MPLDCVAECSPMQIAFKRNAEGFIMKLSEKKEIVEKINGALLRLIRASDCPCELVNLSMILRSVSHITVG